MAVRSAGLHADAGPGQACRWSWAQVVIHTKFIMAGHVPGGARYAPHLTIGRPTGGIVRRGHGGSTGHGGAPRAQCAGGGFNPPRTGVELRLQLRVAGSRNHEPATAPKLAPCSIPFISKRPANLAQVVIHTKSIMAGH